MPLTQLAPFGGALSSNSLPSLGESQALTLSVVPLPYFGKISGLIRSSMTHTHVLSLILWTKTYRSGTSWRSRLCMKRSTSRCRLKRMMRSDNYRPLPLSFNHRRRPQMFGTTCAARETSSQRIITISTSKISIHTKSSARSGNQNARWNLRCLLGCCSTIDLTRAICWKEGITTTGMTPTVCSVTKASKKLLSTWFSPAFSAGNVGINLASPRIHSLADYKLSKTRGITTRHLYSWKNSLWRPGASGRRGIITMSELYHHHSSLAWEI